MTEQALKSTFERFKRIHTLRKQLERGVYLHDALRISGITKTSYYYYRSTRPRFIKLVDAASRAGDDFRAYQVEEGQFKKLKNGTASGSEYEFYLTNRRPERWKRKLEIQSINLHGQADNKEFRDAFFGITTKDEKAKDK